MLLYGVSFLLFILLNIMVRNSPVCSRKKKKDRAERTSHMGARSESWYFSVLVIG